MEHAVEPTKEITISEIFSLILLTTPQEHLSLFNLPLIIIKLMLYGTSDRPSLSQDSAINTVSAVLEPTSMSAQLAILLKDTC